MRAHRSGVIAKKLGMTRVFLESGEACPVTLFSLEGCSVIAVKPNGENKVSLQVGSGRAKHVTKPMQGHFKASGVEAKRVLREFPVDPNYVLPVGAEFSADYFQTGSFVDITGVTIGRGFAGVMKRHNFGGLRASHGVSVSHRSHGSTGHRKDPAKVFKNKKMAGHMGCVQVTTQTLKVMDVDTERGLIVVKGCVPGFEGGWVSIRDAIKKAPSTRDKMEGIIHSGQQTAASSLAAESVVTNHAETEG
jgi:large subunit ribosomal protein L3